jgi:hypothetical protein
MPTSGSVDFSVSRDNILTDALILAGAVGPDDSVPSNWTTHAARQLNKVVKALASKRIGLWARKTGYILPVSDTNSTILGPSGGHATLSYTRTALAADVTDGATSITVDSATGIADTYNIGIEQSDGSMHWTTVSGAPVGTTITLTTGVTEDCDDDAYVWVYQTKLQRPVRIVSAYISDLSDSSNPVDREIDIVGKAEYDLTNAKATEGDPVILAYDPQLDNGIVYYWPRFVDGKSLIVISFQRPFEDFDASSDTPDFPQEWYDALCYLTAVRLAGAYGMPASERGALRSEANDALMLALENEPEEGSLFIQPDWTNGSR